MKVKYLSYAQAYAIFTDYQHLQGQQISPDFKIDLITIAPYSRILQWQFVRQVLQRKPVNTLLQQNPTARYDVIIVSKAPQETSGFFILDVRSYLAQAGMAFDALRYDCLPSQKKLPQGIPILKEEVG